MLQECFCEPYIIWVSFIGKPSFRGNGVPSLAGMIPLAGLANAFDAGYDADSGDVSD